MEPIRTGEGKLFHMLFEATHSGNYGTYIGGLMYRL